MGNCSDSQSKSDKALETVDPPVAAAAPDVKESPPAEVPEESHPAPITVDLNDPPVDLNAPLDDRDIELVQQTFARVAMLGPENVGWVLFMNIFEIAPQAKELFPFKDEANIAKSSRMKAHAGKVVCTVAAAVSLLRDLPTLVPTLHSLGLRHVGYGVVPQHYDIVGQALIKALGTALGPKMTPAVTNAYLKVFTIVKTTMLEKCDYSKTMALAEEPKTSVAENHAKESENGAVEASQAETDEKKKDDKHAEPKKAAKKGAAKQKAKQTTKKADDGKSEAQKKEEEEAKKKKEAEEKKKQLLLSCCEMGDVKNVKKLLDEGVGLDAVNVSGMNALHVAARSGSEELVKLFLKKGLKVMDKTPAGDTALHLAAQSNDVFVCAVVAKADPKALNEKNSAGKVPVEMVHPGVTGKDLTAELKKWQGSGKVPAVKSVGGKKILQAA